MHSLADIKEIYPGSKLTHFRRIKESTGIEYSDMLFFDNENWNIKAKRLVNCCGPCTLRVHPACLLPFSRNVFLSPQEVSRLGVVCVYTPDGMTNKAWREGLDAFARNKRGH